jgi:hypothetical protein
MKKRHINEFQKTELANNGRAAGAGIMEDNYGDEYRPDYSFHKQPKFDHKRRGTDGEVVVIESSGRALP